MHVCLNRMVSISIVGMMAMSAVACSSDSSSDTSGNDGRDQGAGQFAGEDHPNGDGGTATSTDLSIENFAFSPSSLNEPACETISIQNKDSTTHTFTVDKSKVDVQVSAGDSVDVPLALKPGDYDFHCSIHPSMTGTLTIT